MIRVAVVDDEQLVRSGLRMILGTAPDIEVVADCGGGEAVATVAAHAPDVVLLDIRMPDVDGLTVLRALRAAPDPPRVAMLTTFDTEEYLAAALRAGAAGFLLKDTDPEQLVRAVRTLAGGGSVLDPGVTHAVIGGYLAAEAESTAAEAVRGLTRASARCWGCSARGWPIRRSPSGWGWRPARSRTMCARSSASWAGSTASRPRSSPTGRGW